MDFAKHRSQKSNHCSVLALISQMWMDILTFVIHISCYLNIYHTLSDWLSAYCFELCSFQNKTSTLSFLSLLCALFFLLICVKMVWNKQADSPSIPRETWSCQRCNQQWLVRGHSPIPNDMSQKHFSMLFCIFTFHPNSSKLIKVKVREKGLIIIKPTTRDCHW